MLFYDRVIFTIFVLFDIVSTKEFYKALFLLSLVALGVDCTMSQNRSKVNLGLNSFLVNPEGKHEEMYCLLSDFVDVK